MKHIGLGVCHGTFGELAQGERNGRPFLITLPITNKSKAIFVPSLEGKDVIGPPLKQKATLACQRLLDLFGKKYGGELLIESDIPIGKGMASSTADIVASLKAVADAFDYPLHRKLISQLAVQIEPTDGLMYEDVCAYDYQNGELIERFGRFPHMMLMGIDFGGEVNTILFNERKKGYHSDELRKLTMSYEYIKDGIKGNKTGYIIEGTTISADINQRFLEKPYYRELKALARSVEGGLVIAHSGTVLGILVDSENDNKLDYLFEQIKNITKRIPFNVNLL